MMSQAQVEAFEEDVRRFHDRPIEFIPRTELGTTYGGVDLTDRLKSDNDVSCGGHRAATCSGCPQGHGASKTFCLCVALCIYDLSSMSNIFDL